MNDVDRSVKTEIAKIKPFEYIIHTNGKVKAAKEQNIISEIGGFVKVCRAETGRFFSQDELIIQTDTFLIRQKIEKAELLRYNSLKEYESQLLGYEKLLQEKKPDEADEIIKKLKISSGFLNAELDIKAAHYELSLASLKAPFNGVLADVKVMYGSQLKPGQEVFKIYDPKDLFVEVKLLETDIQLLDIGINADIYPISMNVISEKKYQASLHEINPYVDENGMIVAKLKIKLSDFGNNQLPKSSLLPGMNCIANLSVKFKDVLVIPKEAIIIRNGKAVVFTVKDGKANWNYVKVGRDNGKDVEIKSGLKPYAEVIISNNLQLADGVTVKVIQ